MKNSRFSLPGLVCMLILGPLAALRADAPSSDAYQTKLDLHLTLRSYYANDQRLQWSGLEASFVAEGNVQARYSRQVGPDSWLQAGGELFINQSFDKNILTDPQRGLFMANFRINTITLSRLFVGYQSGALTLTMGKIATPFGRFYYNPLINDLTFVAPFIRSEVILPRETGLLCSLRSGILSIDFACTSGVEDRDTNSSVAPILRIGLQGDTWALGISGKKHDGSGSAGQKMYGNYFGADAMVRIGPFCLSGEATYDEYGFKHEFALADIYWQRSWYYRELHRPDGLPLKGYGGYGNLQCQLGRVVINLNYGEYAPEKFGNIYQDAPIKRGFIMLEWTFTKQAKCFAAGLWENNRPHELWSDGARGIAAILGLQYEI